MRIVKSITFIVAVELGLSAVFPVSYAILHYPQPDQWTLPMDYR